MKTKEGLGILYPLKNGPPPENVFDVNWQVLKHFYSTFSFFALQNLG